MHKKFKDIATKYEIAEETSKQILAGLKIENIDKNPSPLQLESFELVCSLLKEGVDLASAIARVEESWRQSEKEGRIAEIENEGEVVSSPPNSANTNGQVKTNQSQAFNPSSIDSIIEQQAQQAVEKALASLPNIGKDEYDRIKETFVLKFREHFIKKLLGSNFQEDFASYVDNQVEEHKQGKLKYIESLQAPLIFSPENLALPPEK